ncbi:hypothetical protein B0H63DRAFT_471238 [Podospora didyma]|uniref:Clr5 domain-containing protein n=1 Tax=Podospora didyma TaxID=330526 RepID=A0AAE0NUK8_9PEZI|nr:hypothetical protein B0H63DRAFT_471238 [Podospora didyma]
MRTHQLPPMTIGISTMFPSENRAAAPANATAFALGSPPTDRIMAMGPSSPFSISPTALQDSNSPDRKSRTLQGPSAKDWAQHRERIIALYRRHPLKRVSETMRREYGFSASKRMYDKRFREWNVFKNVNSEEKGAFIKMANELDKETMSQDEVRRAVRHGRTIVGGVRRAGATDSSLLRPPVRSTKARRPSHPTQPNVIVTSPMIKEQPDFEIEPDWLHIPRPSIEEHSPRTSFSSSDLMCATPTSDTASSDDRLSTARSASNSPMPPTLSYQKQMEALAKSPPPYMTPDSKTRILEVITFSIRDYYDWQLQNIPDGVLPDDYLGHRQTEQSTKYWSDVKNALYLVKISTSSAETPDQRPDRRAWPAFIEAGDMAGGAMTTQPFDFLRNVFATLSPANTSARPELRHIILKFLATEAKNKLSPTHPIALILEELQNDESCQEISRRGLQCMIDVFNSRLGRSRAVTFKLLHSLATLLRRNGELQASADILTELLSSCRQTFGQDSDQARAVENELAHYYMTADESGPELDRALNHCMAVVKRPQFHGVAVEEENAFYEDGIAAHTMEDIAEIHQRRGDVEQCITWLERAASIALKIWGPRSLATGHIIDKVTSLQRQFGSDLLRNARRWESAIV